jgi:anhydro-N-acetylmuramic acid kinase
MSNARFYLGLMSGTSADGVDLALVDFSDGSIELFASFFTPYHKGLHQKITHLYQVGNNEIDLTGSLDIELSYFFSNTIKQFLIEQNIDHNNVIAIGNHGQTIRHRPTHHHAFTMQIGCSQTLATLTGIRVIGDFRKKDMVYGGQGAPLVPAFHQALFPQHNNDFFVVNIGGIANITYLPSHLSNGQTCALKQQITGFDTGPGNALLDAWYQQYHQGRYDDDGQWAKSGETNNALLNLLLSDPYFQEQAPKSSGREYFHLAWLTQYLDAYKELNNSSDTINPEDIQATLLALTVVTIANEILQLSHSANVYICGGGALNSQLMKQLKKRLKNYNVEKTEQLAIDGDALEAMAFSWFAYAFDHKLTGNIPSVTGASQALVLGVEYNP